MEWWVSGADCGVSKGWPRCEEEPGNASFVLPSSADLFINKVVVVLSVRVPASVGVSTAQPRLAGCAWLPVRALTCCGHESLRTSPTSSSVTTIAIAIAVLTAASVGERARRAPISSKTSTTKLHVRFVRMCGGIFEYMGGGGGRWSGG